MCCRFTDHFHLEPNWFQTLKLEAICISQDHPGSGRDDTWHGTFCLNWLNWLDYPYRSLWNPPSSGNHHCLGSGLYWRFIRCTKPRTLHTVMGSARRSNTCSPKTAQNIQKHPTTWHSIFNSTVGKNQDHDTRMSVIFFCTSANQQSSPVFLPIDWLCSSSWVMKLFFSLLRGGNPSILCSKTKQFHIFHSLCTGSWKLEDSISFQRGHCEGTDSANLLRRQTLSKFFRIPSQKIHMFTQFFPYETQFGDGAQQRAPSLTQHLMSGWFGGPLSVSIWKNNCSSCDSHRSFRRKNM